MIPEHLIRLAADAPFKSVADIGAANGLDTVRYAVMFPEATVYGFEPVPENVSFARDLIAKQIPPVRDRIRLYDFALNYAPEKDAVAYRSLGVPYPLAVADQRVVDGDGNWRLSSSLLPPKDHLEVHPWCRFREERWQVDTLDDWAEREGVTQIDFISMDVQGSELNVLAGGAYLLATVKAIWMEVSVREMYEGQPLARGVARAMKWAGFRLVHEEIAPGKAQGDHLYVRT